MSQPYLTSPHHRLRLRLRLFFFIVLSIYFTLPMPASGQQPFYTDDSDVTPKGRFHFELSNEFDFLQRSAYPSIQQNTMSFELGYGLLDNVEISIETPLITIFNAEGTNPRRVSGIGDTNFAVKYNFRKEKDNSRLPAMSVGLNIELPTGDVARQLGSGIADYSLNAIMQQTLTERTKLRLNGGAIFSGNTVTGAIGIKARGLVATGGASLVRAFTPKLGLGVEITGATTRNSNLSKGQLQVQIGGNYLLRDNLSLDFGILAGRFSASPHAGAQLGISIDF